MPWWRSRGWHGREDVGGEGGERRWGRRASETSGGDPRIHYVSSPSTGGGRGGRAAVGQEADNDDDRSRSAVHVTAELIYGLDGDVPPPALASGPRQQLEGDAARVVVAPEASAAAPSSVLPPAPFGVFAGRTIPGFPTFSPAPSPSHSSSAGVESRSAAAFPATSDTGDGGASHDDAIARMAMTQAEELARERRRAEKEEWERQRARREAERDADLSAWEGRRREEEDVWRDRTAKLSAMRASAEIAGAESAERREGETERIICVAEGLKKLQYAAPGQSRVPCSKSREEVLACQRSELGRRDPLACRPAVDRFAACASLRAGFEQLSALDVGALSRGESRVSAGEEEVRAT